MYGNMCGLSGSSPLGKDANLPPHQTHAECQLPRFPQAFDPNPYPLFLSTPYIHTCDMFQAS
jgi:hypothetical protein